MPASRHAEAPEKIAGEYEALTLREWEARGCGYRGWMLGG